MIKYTELKSRLHSLLLGKQFFEPFMLKLLLKGMKKQRQHWVALCTRELKQASSWTIFEKMGEVENFWLWQFFKESLSNFTGWSGPTTQTWLSYFLKGFGKWRYLGQTGWYARPLSYLIWSRRSFNVAFQQRCKVRLQPIRRQYICNRRNWPCALYAQKLSLNVPLHFITANFSRVIRSSFSFVLI